MLSYRQPLNLYQFSVIQVLSGHSRGYTARGVCEGRKKKKGPFGSMTIGGLKSHGATKYTYTVVAAAARQPQYAGFARAHSMESACPGNVDATRP